MLRVYLETTIPSCLTAKPSRDLIVAAHQEVTRQWWERGRSGVESFVSELVLAECGGGDQQEAEKRLAALAGIAVLDVEENCTQVAEDLVQSGLIPAKAAQDAIHVGTAVVHNMDVLLTWNCRHLANGAILRKLTQFIRTLGYEAPAICTPDEMLGEEEP